MQNYTRRNRLTTAQEKERFFTETHENFVEPMPQLLIKSWMKKPEVIKDQQILDKLIQGGRTNLSEWFENIANEFCEEKAIEERTLVETV